MRLFVAVELGSGALAAATSVSDLLRAVLTRTAPQARLTWVPPERMHLTLRFIGDVDELLGERITEALAQPFRTSAFPLTLGSPGAFPLRGAPRVLWLGVKHGREELQRLEKEVSRRVEGAGVASQEHPFNPHLTLARVRDPDGLRSAAALEGVHAPPGADDRVEAITLFESRLSPKGATYTALQRTPLRRA